jgi:ATP-dependent DNA helicase HFM1/MER3
MAIQWNSAILLRNCLELVSSLTGSAWHSNPKIHQQIPGIGIISAKTLFSAGIKSISSLKEVDDTRIELLLKRNPPFGRNLKKQLNLQFPNIDLNCNILDLEDRKMSIDIPRIEKFGNSCKYLVHLLAIAYDSSSSKGRILLYEKISLSHLEKVSFSRSISLKGLPEKSFSCSLMFENWAGLNQNVCFDIEGAPKIPKTEEIDSEVKAPCLITNQRQIIAESESKINQLNSDHDYNIESPDSTSNYDFEYTSPSPIDKVPISPQSNASTPISCNHKCKDLLGCAHPCCKKGLLTHNSPKDQKIVRKPQFMAGAKRSLTNAREYLRKYQPIPASTNFTNCLIPQAVKKKSEEDENVLYDEIEFVLRYVSCFFWYCIINISQLDQLNKFDFVHI